jgi:GDP-mannose transporter
MSDDKKHEDYAIELGERSRETDPFLPPAPRTPPASSAGRPSGGLFSPANQGMLSILSYCASSILMTTTNKYVLSGLDYNLNFLLLAVQVCRYNKLMLHEQF